MKTALHSLFSGPTLAEAWARRRRENNFDAIRLAAALLVIFSHSFEIAAGAGAFEPLRALTGGQMSFGHLAVLVFFVLSGFLLTHSWQADRQLGPFVLKRGLRIAPALFVVVLISVFVLGPLITTAPIGGYLLSSDTWIYFANLGLYTKHDALPGVFEHLPYVGTVNGPLWTLKFEVMCYGLLAFVGAMRLLRVQTCLAILIVFYGLMAIGGDGGHSGLAYYVFKCADLARGFFAGVLLALLASHVRLSSWVACLCLIGLIAASFVGLLNEVFPLLGGYIVLWAGFLSMGRAAKVGQFGDFSYGLYLWGWPMQQLVEYWFDRGDWAFNIAVATPLALGCAVLSWRFIEAPALAMKKRFGAAPSGSLASHKPH